MVGDKLQDIKRKLNSTTIVAVSKYRSKEEILTLYDKGQRIFAENRVQPLLERIEELPNDIEWHLIGHLQTNKVKYIVNKVALIHSVDSVKLLKTINDKCKDINKNINVLLQVKVAKEETKYGFDIETLKSLHKDEIINKFTNVNICGLMAMSTLTDDTNQITNEFNTAKDFYDFLKMTYYSNNKNFNTLSMGMSSDYEIAVNCGSNMVRLGSILFQE